MDILVGMVRSIPLPFPIVRLYARMNDQRYVVRVDAESGAMTVFWNESERDVYSDDITAIFPT